MEKLKELTSEQIEDMSYTDIAFYVLESNGKKMKIQDLFKKVITIKGLPKEHFESKIGDFFGLISTDKRFTMIEKGFWDLKTNHVSKVVIEEDEEDEEIIVEDTEEETEDEIIEDNYDDVDDVSDEDDEENVYKDLVIIDENDETESM